MPFQSFILRWYALHGRSELPWRQTDNPYHILVSELMLQQTQVERVVPKYLAFIQAFPDLDQLAQSSLAEVLELWQGLGYNRRAKYVHQLAQIVRAGRDGVLPQNEAALRSLPGIGPYTAAAIRVFAYNQPDILIETNVRAVFLYHFFYGQTDVPDTAVLEHIRNELYTPNPREWYWALMDYGSTLKKLVPNPSRKSKHHQTQSRFVGSKRQVRGEILRLLLESERTQNELKALLTTNPAHFDSALTQLVQEGMVLRLGDTYRLP